MSEYEVHHDSDDDPVMPEDAYFHDIAAKIQLKDDDLEDIENLEVVAPPPPRPRDQNGHAVQHSDPSDTLYGANTNTYTTDDNASYPNPALITNPRAVLAQQETMGTCGGEDDEMCACGEQSASACGGGDCEEPESADAEAKAAKKAAAAGGCGSGNCGCDDGVRKKETTTD
eukprot:UN04059